MRNGFDRQERTMPCYRSPTIDSAIKGIDGI